MTADSERVPAALAALTPSGLPAGLEERVRASAANDAEREPRRWAFEEHSALLHGYLLALLEDPWEAEQVLTRVFARLEPGADPELPELLQRARHGALEALAKEGAAASDRALLLERGSGLSLAELARTWSALPARLEERLRTAARDAVAALSQTACAQPVDVSAALVDLLDDGQAESYAKHLESCEACAGVADALENTVTTRPVELPAPEKTWKRVVSETDQELAPVRSAQELGIQVAVSCCYCHDRLRHADAAFCASCLAPHHPDCFREHGTCSAPGCGGLELIMPTRPLPRRVSPWLQGLGVVAVLAGTAAAAAFGGAFWTMRSMITGARVANEQAAAPPAPVPTPEVSAAAPQEIPDTIVPGCSRAELVAALGEPDAEVNAQDDGWRLSWYRDGARAIFDRGGRLEMASFFGVSDSDGPVDANGNKQLFDKAGWYRAGNWSWRGVQTGMLADQAIVRAGLPEETVMSAFGDRYLRYAEQRVVIVLGPGPDHRVTGIHVGGETSPDANGNVAVRPVSLLQELGPREALAGMLEGAREDLGIKTLAGVRHYFEYADGQRTRAYAVGWVAKGDAFEFQVEDVDLVSFKRSREWARFGARGELIAYHRVGPADDGTEGLQTAAGRRPDDGRAVLELEISRDSAPDKLYHRVVLLKEGLLTASFARFGLPRLAGYAGSPWEAYYRTPLGDEGMVGHDDVVHLWEGRSVRTVTTYDHQVRVDPETQEILRLETEGQDDYWIEPTSLNDFSMAIGPGGELPARPR